MGDGQEYPSMGEPPKDDEKQFNQTLKRMLKTPPRPNVKTDSGRDKNTPSRGNKSRKKR